MSSNNVNIPVLAISLALIAGLAAGLLGWVYLVTEEPIATALQEKTNTALRDVLPAFDNQPGEETVEIGDVTFYIGRNEGEIVGFAGETITPKGYNGDVTVLAGLLPDGTITTVLVTKQSETPGLGTVVCERKREKTISQVIKKLREKFSKRPAPIEEPGLPPNRILDQFSGMKATKGETPWKVQKDGGTLDAISGATITSRAVGGAVFTIAETFAKNSEMLLKENN